MTPPNKYAQAAGLQLGLSQTQVLVPNFGYHTINAIKAEMVKEESPLPLEGAFAKYSGLNAIQVDGMTKLGLSRQQVFVPNFGKHTINAIKVIQKRDQQISLDNAFAMVRGKSWGDTEKFVKSYLESTKKAQKAIHDMELIRVIVNGGRSFGHQRAAITLIQKLRQMGFKGIFDIRCDDRIGANIMHVESGEFYNNSKPLVMSQLIDMIPGLESSSGDSDTIQIVPKLGAIKISSLPHDYRTKDNFSLPPADLAVSAAEDFILPGEKETKTKIFNAPSYISLEPTDWYQGSCFTVDQDGIVTDLPGATEMRLSSADSYQQLDLNSIELSLTERKILDIINDVGINSQLVYGLYPARKRDNVSGVFKDSGHLDEAIEVQRIVDANVALSQKTGKPAILLLPQEISLNPSFIEKVKDEKDNVHFIDLTTNNLDIRQHKVGDVVIGHTGVLQQQIFDHLMLNGTTLPPVIEGCNSRETCEAYGKPFIHGSSKGEKLRQYDVESKEKQELHAHASLCLKQGDTEYLPQLIRYMEESLERNPALLDYHSQRREAFFRRPDACEVAFDALGIEYTKALRQADMELSDRSRPGKYTSKLLSGRANMDQKPHERNI